MSRRPRKIDDQRVAALITEGLTNSAIAREIGCDEASVRRARKRLKVEPAPPVNTGSKVAPAGRTEFNLTGDTGSFTGYVSETPLTDFSDVFRLFNRDPDEFVIVDDSVSMKAWQQSKGLEDGTRSTVTLYSYGARFRRKTDIDTLDLPALYAAAQTTARPAAEARADRTTVVVWSDPQVGKVASRGDTEALIARSVEKRSKLAEELRRRAPKACVLLDGGDGIEGFESGGNPLFTNDLSLTRQLDLYGTELMEWIKVMLPWGHVDVLAVPSNHAAWRNGKQNLGTPGDDLGLFMHRQIAKVATAAGLDVTFNESAEYDESAAINIDGTVVGLVHGNQFGPGQAVTWWEKQTFGAQAVATADVLVTGHYHSFGAGVAGRNPASKRQRWWLGAPTIDNGSDWYRNTAGRDSDPGVMIFDITPDGFDLGSLTIL